VGSNEVGDSLGLGRDHTFAPDLASMIDNAVCFNETSNPT